MSTINFTCPHCSFSTQLASNTEGMKGNCPSCKADVVISADDWYITAKLKEVAEEKEPEDEHDDESIQNSDISNVIGCLVILGLFLVAAYFIRNWVISVDGDMGIGDAFAPLFDLVDCNLDGVTLGAWLCIGGVLAIKAVLVVWFLSMICFGDDDKDTNGCFMLMFMLGFLAVAVGCIIMLVTRLW